MTYLANKFNNTKQLFPKQNGQFILLIVILMVMK